MILVLLSICFFFCIFHCYFNLKRKKKRILNLPTFVNCQPHSNQIRIDQINSTFVEIVRSVWIMFRIILFKNVIRPFQCFFFDTRFQCLWIAKMVWLIKCSNILSAKIIFNCSLHSFESNFFSSCVSMSQAYLLWQRLLFDHDDFSRFVPAIVCCVSFLLSICYTLCVFLESGYFLQFNFSVIVSCVFLFRIVYGE